MHEIQFLNPLPIPAHHKIIESFLPNVPGLERLLPQLPLRRAAPPSPFSEQTPRKALLQHLHDRRRRAPVWLADQQVNVLGHDYVADYDKAIPFPHLFQDFEK